MQDWMTFFVALLVTCVQWLIQMQIMGVSVLYILIACFIFGIMFRSVLVKP